MRFRRRPSMPVQPVLLQIDAEVLASQEGIWCGVCHLPSGVRAFMAVSLEGELQNVTESIRCRECGEDLRGETNGIESGC